MVLIQWALVVWLALLLLAVSALAIWMALLKPPTRETPLVGVALFYAGQVLLFGALAAMAVGLVTVAGRGVWLALGGH